MDYYHCRIDAVPAELDDLLTETCFRHGAEGVSQALMFEQPNLEYEAHVVGEAIISVDVYFNTLPQATFLEELSTLNPGLKVQINGEINKDWLSEWKKGFTSFELAEGIWITPSWLTPPMDVPYSIVMDPGMAFGTGHHATTRMSAKILVELLNNMRNQKEAFEKVSVLDVGTGTGILALIAKLLGVGRVDAIDNDPESIRVAQEVFQLNKQSNISVTTTPLSEMNGSYDIVVANIIDGVLRTLKVPLISQTSKFLIMSGILSERAAEFIADFSQESGLLLRAQMQDDEWTAVLFEKVN